jgi:hypothetical protein
MILPFHGLFQGCDDGLNKENGVTEPGIVVQVNVDLKQMNVDLQVWG